MKLSPLSGVLAALLAASVVSGCGADHVEPVSRPTTTSSARGTTDAVTEALQAADKAAGAAIARAADVAATAKAATAAKSAQKPERPATGTALAAVAGLTVKGRAPMTGYNREQFGPPWFDTDRNGCDTRNDILRRDLQSKQMKNGCKVLAGILGSNLYTGTAIRFVYGGVSEVDIDHVVALSDAWQKGAARWPAGKRLAFANDPLNLLAADASANRAKGNGDAATWLPPNKSFRCAYVARQVVVKRKYGVWVTAAERDAMTRVLGACPSMGYSGLAPPAVAVPPSTREQPEPAPAQPVVSVYYANCTAVRSAGADPIQSGDPGYSRKLDRDGDGIACE